MKLEKEEELLLIWISPSKSIPVSSLIMDGAVGAPMGAGDRCLASSLFMPAHPEMQTFFFSILKVYPILHQIF